jgi:D-alanine transaminase
MKNLGYYNGRIGLLEEMTVPMLDRATVFGDGIYDATYARNHVIYNLDEHVDRFFSSAAKLRMEVPMTKEELSKLLSELVKKVDSGEQFVYFQLTRGTAPRNHVFPKDIKANLWVMLTPSKVKDNTVPVKLITVDDTRFLHCDIKTLNLIPSVMASQKASEAGCDEAVFCRGEIVTECAHSNVSIIENGKFITHPANNLILSGIARSNLIKTCRRLGIPVIEEAFTKERLMNADEIIVSSSGSFCLSASHIDGVAVGGRSPEILAKLRRELVDDFERSTDAQNS